MEFLLESITSQDNYLHDAMGNIRADSNGIRSDFEGASIHLLEVDLYQRSTESNPTKPNPGKVSAVTFYRGGKTRVDLCWHTRQEFRNISTDHKDELKSCQGSNEGKSYIKNKQTINRKKRKSDLDNSEKENWRKKLKKSINGQSRISHVMSNMREEETNNSSLVAAIQQPLPLAPSKTPLFTPLPVPTPYPTIAAVSVEMIAAALPDLSTKVQLNGILNRK